VAGPAVEVLAGREFTLPPQTADAKGDAVRHTRGADWKANGRAGTVRPDPQLNSVP